MESTNKLLKAADVANILNTSAGNLAKLRFIGKGPTYVRVGRLIRYRREDVEAFIEAGRTDPREAKASE